MELGQPSGKAEGRRNMWAAPLGCCLLTPHPFTSWVFFPPRRPDSSYWLLSTKCLQPHPGKDFPWLHLPNCVPHSSSAGVSDQAGHTLWFGRPGWRPTDPDIQEGSALPMGLLGGEREVASDSERPLAESETFHTTTAPRRLSPRVMGPRMKKEEAGRQPLGRVLRQSAVHCVASRRIYAHQPSLGLTHASKRFNPVIKTGQQNSQKGQQSKALRSANRLRALYGLRSQGQGQGQVQRRGLVQGMQVVCQSFNQTGQDSGGSVSRRHERPNGKLRQDQMSRGSREAAGGWAGRGSVQCGRSKQTQLDIRLPTQPWTAREFAEQQCVICRNGKHAILQDSGGLACCAIHGVAKHWTPLS